MDTYTCFVSVTSIVLGRENNHGRYNSNLSMVMIGTYVGEDSSVLTFLSDGTADYYYQPDGKEPIQNQAWSVSGNRVTWKYDGRIDVYADVTNGLERLFILARIKVQEKH